MSVTVSIHLLSDGLVTPSLAIQLVVHYEEGAEHSVEEGDDYAEAFGEIPGVNMKIRDHANESVYEYGTAPPFGVSLISSVVKTSRPHSMMTVSGRFGSYPRFRNVKQSIFHEIVITNQEI